MSDENKPEQNQQEQPAPAATEPAIQPNEAPAEKPTEQPAATEPAPATEEPAPATEEPATQSEPAQEAPAGETPAAPQMRQRAPGDENTIFIGRKSTMGYVLAVVTQFNSGVEKVKVKARGKLISKAVDVAEITRGRFLPDISPKDIIIMTEEVQNEDGTKSKVSSIEIALGK